MFFHDIYKGKKILVTGHTGFKGGWLILILKMLGAEIYGYSLENSDNESLYRAIKINQFLKKEKFADIRDNLSLVSFFQEVQPDFVFHLAAQALVRLSYFEPVLTYETNVMGTLNVLEAARKTSSVKVFVNITTDKCYENKEKNEGYKEDEPMGGYDMYSSSKGCVELLSSSYRRSFLMNDNAFLLATARAGNVIGGGDWAKDRLVVDCIKAIMNDEIIFIRSPLAVRPWQFVLEPLTGYLRLGQMLWEYGSHYAVGYNFGPDQLSVVKVSEIAEKIILLWGSGKIEIGKADNLHEATLLQLDNNKAKHELGVEPVYSVDEALEATVSWYKNYYLNKDIDMATFSEQQIQNFFNAAASKGIHWCI